MSVGLASSKSTPQDLLQMPVGTCFALPPVELLRPRRLDLIVKWHLFKHLKDPEAQNMYLWHIHHRRQSGFVDSNKDSLGVFIPQASALFASMALNGFDPAHPVPVDPNGNILGGAHRVACALALGVEAVCERRAELVWAPPWDAAWFRQHGMPEEVVGGLLADMDKLRGPGKT